MKYIVKTGMILEGRMRKPGDIVELASVPPIIAADLEPLATTAEIKESKISEPVRLKLEHQPILFRLAIFTTGACDMSCAHCSQAEFRKHHKHQDFAVVKHVLDTIKANKPEMVMSITGGEPTMWPHLRECLEYIKQLGFADCWMYSNGSNADITAGIVADGLVNILRTNAANCRKDLIALRGKYPEIVRISSAGHIPLPKSPTWNSLPAACNCPGVALQGEYIYPCPNFYSIHIRHKWDMESYVGKAVFRYDDPDWLEKIQAVNRYNMRHCMFCEANKYYQLQHDHKRTKRYAE